MFLQEAVVFDPLRRTHAGSYSCEAKNFLGNSQAINVDIDVKCKSYIYFLSLFLSPLDSHTIQCKYSQIMRDHIFFLFCQDQNPKNLEFKLEVGYEFD